MIYRLIVLNGPRQGQRIAIEKQPMTIGRDPECAIVFPDEDMARRHATIEQTAAGLLIHDLGSMGRIVVNGREVRESRLKHGDEVEIGRTRFLVQALVEAEVERGGRRTTARRRLALAAALAVAALAVAGLWGRLAATERRKPAARPPAPAGGASTQAWPAPNVATAAAPPAAQGVSGVTTEEIERLKQELIGLRRMVGELATQRVEAAVTATAGPPAPAAVVTAQTAVAAAPEPPPKTPEERAREAVRRARELAAAGDLTGADTVLAGIQEALPDFLPAYEERADLFERRGKIAEAIEQWLEVIERGATGTAYERAADEYFRLNRLEVQRAAGPAAVLRIAGAEQRKFPDSPEFSEMRSVTVRLAVEGPTNGPAPEVRAAEVGVEVLFFDRQRSTGRIVPSRALTPRGRLRPNGLWRPGETKSVTATYVAPREAGAERRDAEFYGYVVRLFYGDRLQDEEAAPKRLLYDARAARP